MLEDELKAEREVRIRELEGRLARRPPVGVKAPVALIAIAAAAFLLFLQRRELAYFFSPRAPISLGREGEYRFDGLRSNRYAQLHGQPTARGVYALEGGEHVVLVGLRDTPVLVRRRAFPSEEWVAGRVPSQPDQRPFAVGGRLLVQEDASRYGDAFEKLASWREVKPASGRLWVLLEGERPGEDRGLLLEALVLGLFMAANAWFLWKTLTARRRGAAGSLASSGPVAP